MLNPDINSGLHTKVPLFVLFISHVGSVGYNMRENITVKERERDMYHIIKKLRV